MYAGTPARRTSPAPAGAPRAVDGGGTPGGGVGPVVVSPPETEWSSSSANAAPGSVQASAPATAQEPVEEDAAAAPQPEADPARNRLRRQVVAYASGEAPGTIVIDTANTYLYLVLGNGKALRYGIGVGREGFTWAGSEKISRKAEWPDWYPPQDMLQRQPYLPRFMAGGPGNPMGARALYIGATVYRLHGTNQPQTIGHAVSSGCFRMVNPDIIDLYSRVPIGTKVVVLHAPKL